MVIDSRTTPDPGQRMLLTIDAHQHVGALGGELPDTPDRGHRPNNWL